MLIQIATYFEKIFYKYQHGFRKDYSAQYCLLAMIEKWNKVVNDDDIFGAPLTDLSKAFDFTPHGLIITKVQAYSFHIDVLKLIHDYLSNSKQSVFAI